MTSTPRFHPGKKNSALALIAAGLLFSSVALAKQSDRNQPMSVDATSGNMFLTANSKTTISGHVNIVQGTLKITGDRAELYSGANGSNIVRAVIFGNPAHIQQLDDSGNLMTGDANKLDYDNVKAIAVLTGNAVVTQKGRGKASGDKLTYNTATSQMTGESGGTGRLHMTFEPKNAAPVSAPTPAPAPAASAGKQP